MEVGDKLYRVEDGVASVYPYVITMYVTKLTPCGYWAGWSRKHRKDEDRICYYKANKRYAYHKLTDAINSYKIRKQRQLQYARDTIEYCEFALNNLMHISVDNHVTQLLGDFEKWKQ